MIFLNVKLKIIVIFSVIGLLLSGCKLDSTFLPDDEINFEVIDIIQLPDEHNFYSVEFVTANDGWAVGKAGIIYKTENAGETWSIQNSQTTDDLIKVEFIDELNGYISGTNNLLGTTDGGNSWHLLLPGIACSKFGCIDFVNKEIGWVSGSADGKIYHTANAGSSWTVQQIDTTGRVVSLSFPDESVGYAFNNIRGIYKTLNGGETWNKIEQIRFCSTLYFENRLDGYGGSNVDLSSIAEDKACIYITKDGGNTWSQQDICDAMAVWEIFFMNSSIGFVLSGGIGSLTGDASDWVECGDLFYTTNGGYDWTFMDIGLSDNSVIDFRIYDQNKICILTIDGQVVLGAINY